MNAHQEFLHGQTHSSAYGSFSYHWASTNLNFNLANNPHFSLDPELQGRQIPLCILTQ